MRLSDSQSQFEQLHCGKFREPSLVNRGFHIALYRVICLEAARKEKKNNHFMRFHCNLYAVEYSFIQKENFQTTLSFDGKFCFKRVPQCKRSMLSRDI